MSSRWKIVKPTALVASKRSCPTPNEVRLVAAAVLADRLEVEPAEDEREGDGGSEQAPPEDQLVRHPPAGGATPDERLGQQVRADQTDEADGVAAPTAGPRGTLPSLVGSTGRSAAVAARRGSGRRWRRPPTGPRPGSRRAPRRTTAGRRCRGTRATSTSTTADDTPGRSPPIKTTLRVRVSCHRVLTGRGRCCPG